MGGNESRNAGRETGRHQAHPAPREGLLEGEQNAPDVLMPPAGTFLLVLQEIVDVFRAK